MPQVKAPPPPQPVEDNTWWYVTLLVLFLALASAVMWMLKNKKTEKEAKNEMSKKDRKMAEDSAWEANSFDADKEMEWFRRHQKTVGKSSKNPPKKNLANELPQTGKIFNRNKASDSELIEFSEKEFKEKLQNLQFTQLPIFKFQKIELARPFAPLSISADDALISAVEQTHDEFEEDEEIRDLAVRILAAFKTRNSVEALSQVALYDLSSNLRSKAVSILTDFDHESVFETILLCCGDPTREVRAAAARGLFRLSFDRADAWTRIAETHDEFRMSQATRAAMEADLLTRSFDRLTHTDKKIAYEAVTLLSLMIRAGETALIFKAIETHNDSNVKLALLHVVGLTKDERTLSGLSKIVEKSTVSKEIKAKIEQIIESFEMIPA
ncbi:MAG: HEAT repeat domain-containing protein [Actinomycetota bacterium]